MVRFLMFGVLLYLGFRLASYFLRDQQFRFMSGEKTENSGGEDVLVPCFACKTRVPRQLMVNRAGLLFCSTSCSDS